MYNIYDEYEISYMRYFLLHVPFTERMSCIGYLFSHYITLKLLIHHSLLQWSLIVCAVLCNHNFKCGSLNQAFVLNINSVWAHAQLSLIKIFLVDNVLKQPTNQTNKQTSKQINK